MRLPSLQQRQTAIARAFRDAREPSAEERLAARLSGLEHQIAELSDSLRETSERVAEIDLTGAESFGEWFEDDRDVPEGPSVPTLESPGLMSAVASQALFGHS